MKRIIYAINLLILISFMTGCSGNPQGAGYWFHIIFILLPLILIGVFVIKRIETLHDSVFTIEGQLRRLSGKLDNIDEKIKPSKGKKEE